MIVAGWAIVVGLVLALALRPWRKSARAPLRWAVMILVVAWILYDGGRTYDDLIAQSSWTAASVTMGYVPMKAMLLAFLAYAAVWAVQHAVAPGDRRAPRVALAGGLAGLCVIIGISDVRDSIMASRLRLARSPTLTPAQIEKVAARVTRGDASPDERSAFIANPLCPLELLSRAVSGTVEERTGAARNPSLAAEEVVALSKDEDASVRYYAARHPKLPETELPRLAADASASVRGVIAWKPALPDADFERLTSDPDFQVRYAVTLQSRTPTEVLRRLSTDADPFVRSTATRKLGERNE